MPGTVTSTIYNLTSTLTLSASTSARSSGTLVASSSTAASVVVPQFALPDTPTGIIPRLRLSCNDATSTAWGSVGLQVDIWSAAPTFTNGDGGAWALATGSASHLGTYTGTFSAVNGDGVYAELAPTVGTVCVPVSPGSTIFWTLQTTSASGVTAASKSMNLTVEIIE